MARACNLHPGRGCGFLTLPSPGTPALSCPSSPQMYVWLNKEHVGGGSGLQWLPEKAWTHTDLWCFSLAWPPRPSWELGEWPPGAALVLPGRAPPEGWPQGEHWALRAAGTEVSTRPEPTGSCFKYGSRLLGNTEVRSDQDCLMKTGLLPQKREVVSGSWNPEHGRQVTLAPMGGGRGPGCGTRLVPSQAHITSVISGAGVACDVRARSPVCPGLAGDPALAQDLSLLALWAPLSSSLKRDPCLASLPGTKAGLCWSYC